MEVWGEEKVPWPIAMAEAFLDKVDLMTDFVGKRKFKNNCPINFESGKYFLAIFF
jgi:hypothetical protein